MNADSIIALFIVLAAPENPEFARAWAKEYLWTINRDRAIFMPPEADAIAKHMLNAWGE